MNDYSKELKKLIKIIKTPKKPFNERLVFYKQCFEDYKKWRFNFKFPKTVYMSRIKTLKPLPSTELVKNLAKSVSELRGEFLQLKDYKPVLIFKLFLFFFAETFKAKNKIKINKSYSGLMSGWVTGGKTPTRRDIDTIIGEIVDLFKFAHLSDGDASNQDIKIGILNIKHPIIKASLSNFKSKDQKSLIPEKKLDAVQNVSSLDIINSGIYALENSQDIAVPMLVFHGKKDRLTSYNSSKKLVENSGSNVKFIGFKDAYHEIHNDSEKEELLRNIFDWINSI